MGADDIGSLFSSIWFVLATFSISGPGIPSFALAWSLTLSLLSLNSSLNPFLYFLKIREVRQAVKETIRQVWCCCLEDECLRLELQYFGRNHLLVTQNQTFILIVKKAFKNVKGKRRRAVMSKVSNSTLLDS